MLGLIKRRPWLAATVALPLIGYSGIIGHTALNQRQMLFETRDDGQLAAAGGLAIEGSERIAITTSDRETIAAWYVAPRAGQPVFLFLHGQGGRLVRQTERWTAIRQAGFGVLAVSYRGYPGSTGSPSEAGLALDARAAYDWLRTRHKPSEIVLHGHSMGTGVVVPLAAQVEARALVLEAPFTAAVDVAAERMPLLPVRLLMRDPFRSRDHIGKVRMPVLIVHGDQDRVVPFAHGERMLELSTAPKRLERMSGSGHNGLSRDGLYDRIKLFLREMTRS